MREGRIKNTVTGLCIVIMTGFMLTILVRILTKNILINQMGMDNLFTRIVFYGDDEILPSGAADEHTGTERVRIDWQELYPFAADPDLPEEEEEEAEEEDGGPGMIRKLEAKADIIKHGIERYTSNHLAGYSSFVDLYNRYEEMIGWNIASTAEYNGVVEFSDGHLMVYCRQMDTEPAARSLSGFYEQCREKGIGFLYVQAPYKVCKYQDTEISGILDFSNQNADMLLERAADAGVPCLDLREEFHKEDICHHDMFYRTDHHWTTETALQAAALIAERLNEESGFSIDLSIYREDAFEKQIYKDWFLGSSGRKVTLARTEPEDITLYYPLRETDLSYRMPELELDVTGDFSITYDMSQVETRDYYRLDPYGAYNHSGGALVQIQNHEPADEKKVLFVGDSYLNSVFPFLSLGIEYADMLDLRDFNGSVEAYIDQTGPDAVVVLYNPSSLESVDESVHTGTFDFR